MLIEVQFPFADVRRFVSDDTGRLTRPQWPWPAESEFVRNVGPIRRRRRGPVDGLGDEAWVCDISKLVRTSHATLVCGRGAQQQVTKVRRVFQRLVFDGRAVGRFSLGFVASQSPRLVGRPDPESIIRQLLTMPLELRFEDGPIPLVTAGRALARTYVRSTSRAGSSMPKDWWVRSGAPVVLVEARDRTSGGIAWSLPSVGPEPSATPGIGIFGGRAWYGDNEARLWAVAYHAGSDARSRRNWRLHLLRLHAEHEALKAVIGAILSGSLHVGAGDDALQAYLRRAERWHTRVATSGISSAELLDATGQAFDLVAPSDRDTLLEAIAEIRPQLISKFAALTAPAGAPPLARLVVEVAHAEIHVTEDRSQHINTGGGSMGNVVGSNASVGGSVTSTQTFPTCTEES